MKIDEIVKESLKKLNLQLKKKDKITYNKSLQIFGPKSKLDSLLIVNLFIEIENKVKKITKKEINLLNEDFFEKGFKFKYTIENLEKDIKKKTKK